MPDAATLASATQTASPTANMAAPLPALPNAMAASPEAAAALASIPAGNRFVPAQATTADDASAMPDVAATPSAPAASPTRQGVNLATLASMVVPPHPPGSAREQRNANTLTSLDLQNPDIASSISGSATDTATREAGPQPAPGSGSARGTHSLIEALGERIAQQLQRGSDRAVIRLDPPMQGQLEITIHRDATGATQVHLAASNGDVARQLQTISDSLRQELVNRQSGEVTVLVSHGGREQGGRQGQQQQAPQDGPGRALADAGTDTAQSVARFALSSLED
jgi:flagellar hook-length control protein FliK